MPLHVSPGGVRADVNPALVPDGWIADSNNWVTRNGEGQPRPGYDVVGSQVAAADRITGIAFRGPSSGADEVVLHTLTAGYHWDGSSVTAITGTWSASSASQLVRMAYFPSGGTNWLARVNEANAVDKWSGSGAFADISGAPTGVDIAAVGNYLVVFQPTKVVWCAFNDIDTWPSLNDSGVLSATSGNIKAGRAFGPTVMAVYKEDGVYVGLLQAAKAAFQFRFVGRVSGPTSAAAVVDINGVHHWLGADHVIYAFDGQQIRVVSTALAKPINEFIDETNAALIHGTVLEEDENEIWWWLPDFSTATTKRAVSYNVQTGAAWTHTFTDAPTASAMWQRQEPLTIDGLDTFSSTIDGLDSVWATIDEMTRAGSASTALLGDASGNFYQFGASLDDDDSEFAWQFDYPYRAPAGFDKRIFMDRIASFWKQTAESFTVTYGLAISDTPDDNDSFTTTTFDTNTSGEHSNTFSGIGQWVKVRHSGTGSKDDLRHRGCYVTGWPRSIV